MAADPATSLFSNVTIWSSVFAWTAAQSIKFIRVYIKEDRLDFRYFVSMGGMPSAHSALVSALATSAGLREGVHSTTFAVTLIFALVVMFDAQGVRRAAGLQARVLNDMVARLVREHHWPERRKLAELLGHSRHEVAVGMLLGVATAFIVHALAGRFQLV